MVAAGVGERAGSRQDLGDAECVVEEEKAMGGALRIGVLGDGRAGGARTRAIEAHPDAELAFVWSRAHTPEVRALEDRLAAAAVDAVAVCTPNAIHPEQTRCVLAAGLHALVEFPLAPSRAEARALLDQAHARGRVLHVGHIELLAPSQARQRARVAELGAPIEGELCFSGGTDGWIGDDLRAGTPALRALARLHRLRDLFGPGEVRAAHLDRIPPGYRLEVELSFGEGRVRLIERRAPDAPRATTWSIRCQRGLLDSPADSSARGVFAQDLDGFVARVRGTGAGYLHAEDELAVLDWIERIDTLTQE